MPTPLPTALEASLAALIEAHNLTTLSVGLSLKQSQAFRFDVTMHWNGHANSGISCVSEKGPSVAGALGVAVAVMKADREQAEIGGFADDAAMPPLSTDDPYLPREVAA